MTNHITYWHEFPSNYSGGQSVGGLGTFFQYGNDIIGGWLGAIMLITIFTISFMVTKSSGGEKAFATSILVTFFMSVLLMRVSLIDFHWVIVLSVFAVIGILVARASNQPQGL